MKAYYFYFDEIPEGVDPFNLVPVKVEPDGRVSLWQLRVVQLNPRLDKWPDPFQIETSLRWAMQLGVLEKLERNEYGEGKDAAILLTEWYYKILMEARRVALAELRGEMVELPGPGEVTDFEAEAEAASLALAGVANSGAGTADSGAECDWDFRPSFGTETGTGTEARAGNSYLASASRDNNGAAPLSFDFDHPGSSFGLPNSGQPSEAQRQVWQSYVAGTGTPTSSSPLTSGRARPTATPTPATFQSQPTPATTKAKGQQSQSQPYKQRQRQRQRQRENTALLWQLSVISGLSAVVILLMILFLPGALKALNNTPATAQLRLAFKDEVAYQVPVQLEQLNPLETSVTLEATGEATGTLQAPDGTAKGSIKLVNAGDSAVSLAAGTIVATNAHGVNYRLTTGVSVGRLDLNTGQAGVAYAEVEADRPGPEGNGNIGVIARGSLRIVGGQVTGGTSKTVKLVVPPDLEKVKAQLLNQLQTSDMAAKALDSQLLLTQSGPEAKRLNRVEIVDTQFAGLPQAGADVAGNGQFSVTLIARVKSYSYTPAQLLAKLERSVSTGLSQTATATTSNVPPPATANPNPAPANSVAGVLGLELQGQPIFKSLELEETTTEAGTGSGNSAAQPKLTLNYVKPVINREAFVSRLSGLSLAPQEFEPLVKKLMAKPELARLDTPALPLALPNGTKRVQLQVERAVQ